MEWDATACTRQSLSKRCSRLAKPPDVVLAHELQSAPVFNERFQSVRPPSAYHSGKPPQLLRCGSLSW
ncbi:hypothetical protein D3C72_2191190 [compost metagenome]